MEQNKFISVLQAARKTKTAIAAINILNYSTARAVVNAAAHAKRPIILQPSTATVKRYGPQEIVGMVQTLRQTTPETVLLHLDHCTDANLAKICVRSGWDSVMVDYSTHPLEENIFRTRQMVNYAHANGVAVEGEIGIIAGTEDDIIHEQASPATLAEITTFVEQTGVDAVAPAIGTAHGPYHGNPVLDFALLEQLSTCQAALVVHGGTGLPESDFRRLIALGAAKINISTALKQVYLQAGWDAMQKEGVSPLAFDSAVENAVMAEMEQFIRLFAGEEAEQ